MEDENKHIENLMQNVSDSLDHLLKEVKELKSTEEKDLPPEEDPKVRLIVGRQTAIYNQLIEKEKLIKLITENKQEIHHKTENVIFGKDTPFSSKLLLSTIILIFISFQAFKYIPEYLIHKSELKAERDTYKMFYDYAVLNSFEQDEKAPNDFIHLKQKIQSHDTAIINYVRRLTPKYKKYLEKEKLKTALKNLEK
ncbi:hypothetical protein [Christiangramia sp. SM2212]|uniref:Uncharacterized protein n=1 Tax=Christiangramia sediminicola TaxID=3073267 RepID=A0ABU1EQ20_9FLAO|nr:hypothetical protein [Christiangramia sp. SM2212]MDR5590482.1 hypothetical protein [Christiangramia sp. SM2212]